MHLRKDEYDVIYSILLYEPTYGEWRWITTRIIGSFILFITHDFTFFHDFNVCNIQDAQYKRLE